MINVISGDIAQIEADALITAINSGGMWFGGIDGVIQRAAGDHFHRQAAKTYRKDGMTIVARGLEGTIGEMAEGKKNRSKFKNVVFVVDDLRKPLTEIVLSGLKAADEAGYKVVSLPTIRMGVMAGVVESPDEAIKSLTSTAKTFMETAQNVKTINIVVYNNEPLEQAISEALNYGDN